MQMYNEQESIHNGNKEYIGASQYYEPSSNHTSQQQASYPPLSDYEPIASHQKPFAQVVPLSDARFAALLSYSGGWVTGLIFTLWGCRDRFIRFHALQSLVFFGTITLLDLGALIFMTICLFSMGMLVPLLFIVLTFFNFIVFLCWIVVMVQAARGVYFRLPFLGDWVARRCEVNTLPRW